MVLLAGPVLELSNDCLALFDSQYVLQVKHGLLPVRILCVRAGRELDGLVAGGEFNVEPGDDGVDEVWAAHLELVGQAEREVGYGALVQVEGDDWGRVGNDGFEVDGVNERLSHGGGLERGIIKTPDIVPDCACQQCLLHRVLRFLQPIFSSLYSPSSIPAMKMVALSGKIRPSLTRYLSRAYSTVSNMDS